MSTDKVILHYETAAAAPAPSISRELVSEKHSIQSLERACRESMQIDMSLPAEVVLGKRVFKDEDQKFTLDWSDVSIIYTRTKLEQAGYLTDIKTVMDSKSRRVILVIYPLPVVAEKQVIGQVTQK